MIITYPTGLFSTILPKQSTDATSVTYTISGSPPRTELLFQKIPPGELNGKQFQSADRYSTRYLLGELAFTSSTSSRTQSGSTSKQYEVGQVLEFTSTSQVQANQLLVSQNFDIQHDTNVIDYSKFGWTSDQIDALNKASQVKYENLRIVLEQTKQAYYNTNVLINENQKDINETQKALNAVSVINDASLTSLIDNLNQRLSALNTMKIELVASLNDISTEASGLADQLRQLAQIVR